MGGHITGSSIYSTGGRFCCHYSNYWSYTLFLSTFFIMRSWYVFLHWMQDSVLVFSFEVRALTEMKYGALRACTDLQ